MFEPILLLLGGADIFSTGQELPAIISQALVQGYWIEIVREK